MTESREKTRSKKGKFNVTWKGIWLFLGSLIILSLFGLALFYALFVTYVEQHTLPYKFDRLTGEVTILERTGYIVTPPFIVEVKSIDLRPHQVMIKVGHSQSDTANKRVLNAKLVQFKKEGFFEFIKLHGLQNGNVSEILKIYAYDSEERDFPFLKVESETSAKNP